MVQGEQQDQPQGDQMRQNEKQGRARHAAPTSLHTSQPVAPLPADRGFNGIPPAGPGKHLIGLDLDGTVIDHDFTDPHSDANAGHISAHLIAAVQKLFAAGHEIVVATGRSADATLPVVERLGIRPEWVVAANGAVTLRRDPFGERGYRRELVEGFDPTELLKRIRNQLLTVNFAMELTNGDFLYMREMPVGTLPKKGRLVSFEEMLGVQASRLIVVSPSSHFEDFIDTVNDLGFNHVAYLVEEQIWLDVSPVGVTKESALAVIAERENIPLSNVFCAGDGRNDLAMLRWAGAHGVSVAMGQALPEVRDAASHVTLPVGQDGLVLALRTRFPAVLMQHAA